MHNHHLQLAASLKPAQVTVCGGHTRLASGPASSRSILDTGYCRTAAEHVTTWFIILSFSFSLVLISMLVSSIFSSSSLLLHSSIIRIPLSHDYRELEGNFSAKKVHPGDLKTAAANEAMGGLFVHHLLCLPEPCQQLLTCAGCLRMVFVVLGMAAAAAWWGEFGGPPSHYNLKDYQELEDDFSAKKAHPGDLKTSAVNKAIVSLGFEPKLGWNIRVTLLRLELSSVHLNFCDWH
ncbi:uncharacterized protein EDB93DRAFT_1110292 [Suillus bovinus]|uniref:uncharacterized protein n=1 Tax=Suillus bovinus TaxID=48563 RepID=UPI001B87B138|nr:uncharacterized protein EDB93DRAFT_1110292 [Suillus bovinus]KAG2125179.1 hypothetical protein EDB93DRAFT_1110292 [Suillus bovinus]